MFAGDWSWLCFARWYCDFSTSMDSCVFFDEGAKANAAYITLEVSALVSGLLLLEKLLAFQFGRDYGSPISLYSFGILMTALHCLATVYWFGITEASFRSDCSDKDRAQDGDLTFCASDGPALAIAALIMSVCTMATFIFVFQSRRKDRVKVGAEAGEFLRISTRNWMLAIAFLQILSASLICLSVYMQKWVKRDSDEVDFVGGLLECKDCHYRYSHLGWDCLTGFMCDVNSKLGYCKMFEGLKDAGRIYVALSATSLVFITLWSQGVVFIIQGREYGFASLNYFYAFASCFFQLLAVCIWFNYSQSSFTADCTSLIEDPNALPSLCSTYGPIPAIAAVCVLGISAILYCLAFYFRGISYIKEVSLCFANLDDSQIELKMQNEASPRAAAS